MKKVLIAVLTFTMLLAVTGKCDGCNVYSSCPLRGNRG